MFIEQQLIDLQAPEYDQEFAQILGTIGTDHQQVQQENLLEYSNQDQSTEETLADKLRSESIRRISFENNLSLFEVDKNQQRILELLKENKRGDLLKNGEQIQGPQQQNEDDQESQYICKPSKKPKNKMIAKQPYPTKNFLPVFKPILLNTIERYNPEASKHPKVIQIKGKKCINLKDCQQLFRISQFRHIFETYFTQKKIYRDLMQSRVKYKLKKIYFEKIDVFEKAFRTGKFQKIN